MIESKIGLGVAGIVMFGCGNTETRTTCFSAETVVVEVSVSGGTRVGTTDLDPSMAPDGGVFSACKDICDQWNFSNAPCKVGTLATGAVGPQDGGPARPAPVR